jgi:hypothetical protein
MMQPQHCAFAASAITFACCACLAAVLKRLFRAECINGQASGSALQPTITSLLVAAALTLGLAAACLVKPLSNRARAVTAAVCSKWQPVYFIILSVQKIVIRSIVISYAYVSINQSGAVCHLSADYVNQFHAATFLWDCAVLMTGVSTICFDLHADATPASRRCAQCLLALCLCTDAVGSYIWGNEMAAVLSLSVTKFEFQLGNLITSCITSQAVLALHFVFVGWRSLHGRGWYYASLRFELDQRGRELLSQLSPPHITQGLKERLVASSSALAVTSEAEAAADSLHSEAAARSSRNALSRARLRFLQFQQRRMSKCQVFVIPCLAANNGAAGSHAEFALARPAFVLRCLRPLQRVADAHPKFYLGFSFLFFGLPSVACAVLLKSQISGICSLPLNTAIFVAFLGFLSSRRYNLDRVAAKEVVLSFRFAVFIVLLSQWIALLARRAYLVLNAGQSSVYAETPWSVAASAVVALFLAMILLLDCSPSLPATAQIILMVTARHRPTPIYSLQSRFLQSGLWFIFGYWSIGEFRRIYAGESPDCFWNFGAYRVCESTQLLSIFSSMFLLMTQALLSHILLPGMSNFVNASVRHLLCQRYVSLQLACLTRHRFCSLRGAAAEPTESQSPTTKSSLTRSMGPA